MDNSVVTDRLSRPIRDLRLSVIDRCNFRCPYCMPKEATGTSYSFLKENKWLSFDEIVRLTKIFVSLGVKKIRLTGGEPLLRPDLCQLIKKLAKVKGIEDLALTTNGSLLADHALNLRSAGLNRLTVSLDSLDARVFKALSGGKGSVEKVLKAIAVAVGCGFESIKVNVVVQRGVNEQSVLALVEHFRQTKAVLRFIEYMDVGNCNHWDMKYVVPSRELEARIAQHFPLERLEANYFGEVSSRYKFKDGKGEIGFISSVSQPFCRNCTRARISTDGKLYTCLFATEGTDLRHSLRSGASDDEITSLIRRTWENREDRYSELRSPQMTNTGKKVEMFQIGG